MTKKKLLLIKIGDYSFVRQDEAVLREHYNVKAFTFGKAKGIGNLLRQLTLLFWLLRNIWGTELVLCWFIDFHAFFPAVLSNIFHKPFFLIVGGYDGANLPEYNYGAHRKPFWSRIIRHNCNRAQAIFPLSQFLGEKLMGEVGEQIRPKIKPVHLGIPAPDVFQKPLHFKKDNAVICVTGGNSLTRVKIKGMDFYKEVAAACPDIRFILVGVKGEAKVFLEENKPQNLEVIEYIKHEGLVGLYNQAKVVCLFSRYEGFGMVVLEGMLCECVPVTVKGIGTSEIVEAGVGFAIESHNIKLAKTAIEQALGESETQGPKAREIALKEFSMEKRMGLIMGEMEKATYGKGNNESE